MLHMEEPLDVKISVSAHLTGPKGFRILDYAGIT